MINLYQLQLGRQLPGREIARGSGMVQCPMKWAGMAIMRCAEIQARERCGDRCPNAAKPEEIRELTRVMSDEINRNHRGSYEDLACS